MGEVDTPAELVSVIVPVFNGEEYVADCLRSVLAQTHRRLEVLVVDDGSTDRTAGVVAEIAAADGRVRVVRHTTNRGVARARNEGVAAARGQWVAFVDADDWVGPAFVETLLTAAMHNDARIAVCGRWEVSETGMRRRAIEAAEVGVCPPREALRRMLTGTGGDVAIWNKICQIGLFRDIRFPADRLYEDVATTYRLLDQAGRVAYLPDPLYYYRQRPGSITQRRVSLLDVDSYLMLFDELGDFLAEKYPGLDAEFARFEAAARLHLLYRMARHGGDAGLWEPVADWLLAHRGRSAHNSCIGWRTQVMLGVLAVSPALFRAVARVAPRMRHR